MKKLGPEAFEELVEDGGQKCLVLVSRKTCHVCQEVHPKIEALEADYPNYTFYEIDVEQQPTILPKYHLKGVPQTMFFAGGNVKAVISGDAPEDDFAEKIEEFM